MVIMIDGFVTTERIDRCIERCVNNNIIVKGRCNSCKFWTNSDHKCRNEDAIEYAPGYHSSPSKYSDVFRYWNCDGLFSAHECGPFFGCVHWKEKENE